jgi:hypothetical protein
VVPDCDKGYNDENQGNEAKWIVMVRAALEVYEMSTLLSEWSTGVPGPVS